MQSRSHEGRIRQQVQSAGDQRADPPARRVGRVDDQHQPQAERARRHLRGLNPSESGNHHLQKASACGADQAEQAVNQTERQGEPCTQVVPSGLDASVQPARQERRADQRPERRGERQQVVRPRTRLPQQRIRPDRAERTAPGQHPAERQRAQQPSRQRTVQRGSARRPTKRLAFLKSRHFWPCGSRTGCSSEPCANGAARRAA